MNHREGDVEGQLRIVFLLLCKGGDVWRVRQCVRHGILGSVNVTPRTYRSGAWNTPSDLYHLRAVPATDNMQAFERAVSGDRPGVVAQRGR